MLLGTILINGPLGLVSSYVRRGRGQMGNLNYSLKPVLGWVAGPVGLASVALFFFHKYFFLFIAVVIVDWYA